MIITCQCWYHQLSFGFRSLLGFLFLVPQPLNTILWIFITWVLLITFILNIFTFQGFNHGSHRHKSDCEQRTDLPPAGGVYWWNRKGFFFLSGRFTYNVLLTMWFFCLIQIKKMSSYELRDPAARLGRCLSGTAWNMTATPVSFKRKEDKSFILSSN